MIRYQTQLSDSGALPVMWRITAGDEAPVEEICAWLGERSADIDAVLDNRGALLIRGLSGLTEAEHFNQAIRTISPELRDYVGGTSPREQVLGRIMTATSTPPRWSIVLHQEMAYTNNPPDRLAFFCQHPADDGGGLSVLGDMGSVLGDIPVPIREKFQRHGLRLRRTLPGRSTVDDKPGVKKLWNEVFETSDRAEVNRIVAERGWEADWLDEDTLVLRQEVLPATKVHPVCGREVWFNQAHFFSPVCMLEWARSDGRAEDVRELDYAREHHPELLDDILYGNDEPVTPEDALEVYRTLKAHETRVALQRSDLLLVDNTLVAHGRTAFDGQRDILVALITMPRFHSAAA